ncbi:MAG: pantoate--beta-alanine ligase [bacterium]|nr:pantoate--beta-alanine ligase [bacterium]
MEVIKNPSEMQAIADKIRQTKRIGLVPTMGALHKGHISLIESAKKETDFVVVSIFVNPIQFGPTEDYKSYPRPYDEDQKILEDLGVDLLFFPFAIDLYPNPQTTFINIRGLENLLCGKIRKRHFKGVLTVVAKLFNITKPHSAFFGQKDYQQALMIRVMTNELNFDVRIRVLPTIREEDGLAISSRNIYLSDDERRKASILYLSLKEAEKLLKKGEKPISIVERQKLLIEREGLIPDYFEIADPETLKPVDGLGSGAVIIVAAKIGKTRLIDNLIVQ